MPGTCVASGSIQIKSRIRFFGNELCDLVGSVAVRINKKSAVALADLFDEKVNEERGFADTRHALDIHVLRSAY